MLGGPFWAWPEKGRNLTDDPRSAPGGSPRLRVLALEPYWCLSHRVFLEGYQRFSAHSIDIWSLPARAWKWRSRAAALHFAERLDALEGGAARYDLVLASDYLDVADWIALAPHGARYWPIVLYFHENQATFPIPPGTTREHEFAWRNLSSALAADRVLFNSEFHRREFLAAAARGLGVMPEPRPHASLARLTAGTEVFPVGIDFDPHRRRSISLVPTQRSSTPTVVWNHRWEYDKDPARAVDALVTLARRGLAFRAILCGPVGPQPPPAYERAASELGERLLHLGYFDSSDDYLDALASADVVLSTARHEFFGVSVAEAMFCGCVPFLPRALSYPGLLPSDLHDECLFDPAIDLADALETFLTSAPWCHRAAVAKAAERFDWRTLAPRLDEVLSATSASPRS